MKTLMITLAFLQMILGGCIVFIAKKIFNSLPKPMKILGIFFAFDILFSISLFILGAMHIHNLFLINTQIPIMYTCNTWALSYWVSNTGIRKTFIYSIPLFLVLYTVSFFTLENFTGFSTVTLPIYSTLLLFYSVYVLVTILNDTSTPVTLQPRFWISSGLIIFNGGSATFFIMLHILSSGSMETLKIATIFHNFISAIAYALFLYGFLCQQRIGKSLQFS